MSCFAEALIDCPNIQSQLDLFFNTKMTLEAMPFAEFVTSPVNNFGLAQVINPTPGKIRTIDLIYQKRLLESSVTENVENPLCVATEKDGNCSAQYTIDPTQNIKRGMLITKADLRYNCENNPDYIAGVIARLIDVVERAVATQIAAEAVALNGGWEANVTPVINDQLIVQTLKAGTTADVYPFTMEEIDMAALQTGYGSDGVFISGGALLYQYFRRVLAGCCTDSGVDIGQIMNLYGKVVTYDKRLVAAYGNNLTSIMTRPGALALLTFNQAGWLNGTAVPEMAASYFSTAIFSPRLNIPMDITMKDDCGNLSINVIATTKLVAGPTDQFSAGDDFEGVNWVNEIKVTNT